jgi:hypothetical protein
MFPAYTQRDVITIVQSPSRLASFLLLIPPLINVTVVTSSRHQPTSMPVVKTPCREPFFFSPHPEDPIPP